MILGVVIMNVQLTIDLPEEAFSVFRTPHDVFINEMKKVPVIK
jgi:hypothetical protein